MTYICDGFDPGDHFVRVLTSPDTGNIFGYRVRGGFPGPQLAVFGERDGVQRAFDALVELPTLPWMRGTMVLLWFDAEAHRLSDYDMLEDEAPIDQITVLPADRQLPGKNRDGLFQILRAATKLGMIAGRGVPANPQDQRRLID